MPRLIAIIVTYNPDEDGLLEQIESIVREDIGVVLVDNASARFPIFKERVARLGSGILDLVQSPENVGLAQAQNIGIETARMHRPSHVIFFDQDSIPETGFSSALLAAESTLIQAGTPFSAVGPATFDPVTGQPYPITKYAGPFIRRHVPKGNMLVEATFLISSGSLVRMEVLDRVGPMRAELFIDYIDVEWCLRARGLGYRCYVASGARMSHRIGDARIRVFGRSISAHSPLRRYYLLRNSFLMLRLSYIPFSYKVREIVLNFLRFSVFLYLSNERRKYLSMMKKAVFDGMSGKYGKFS